MTLSLPVTGFQTKERELQTIFGLRDRFQESVWQLTHNNETIISRDTFNGLTQEFFEQLVSKSFAVSFLDALHLVFR